MIKNFNGKNTKDIETAPESIIQNTCFAAGSTNFLNTGVTGSITSITNQQLNSESFDNVIEKRK